MRDFSPCYAGFFSEFDGFLPYFYGLQPLGEKSSNSEKNWNLRKGGPHAYFSGLREKPSNSEKNWNFGLPLYKSDLE
jgi:hypothetical protein